MRLRGPIAFVGELTLTETHLKFRPTGRLDRLIGAEDVEILLSDITKTAISGINRVSIFWTKAEVYKFLGTGAQQMTARVQAIVEEKASEPEPEPEPEPIKVRKKKVEEPVVEEPEAPEDANAFALMYDWRAVIGFQAEEEIRASEHANLQTMEEPIPGRLIATTHRVLFLPDTGPDGDLKPKLYELDEIRDDDEKNYTTEKIEISIGFDCDTYLPNPGKVFTEGFWKQCVADTVLIQRNGMRMKGPLAFMGAITVTPTHIKFTPTGMLDRLVGVEDAEIEIAKITRISTIGVNKTTIIWEKGEMHRFLGPGARDIGLHLEKMLVRHAEEKANQDEEPNPRLTSKGRIADLMERWGEQIGYDPLEQLGPSTYCMYREEEGFIWGWLIVTDSRLIFLPATGQDTETDPLVIPMTNLRAAKGASLTAKDIKVTNGERDFHFLPEGQEEYVDYFWDHCSKVYPAAIDDEAQERAREQVTGTPLSLSILQDENVLLSTPKVLTIFTSKGFGIVLVDPLEIPLPSGVPITVEVCTHEGVFSFDTVILGIGEVPGKIRIGSEFASQMIMVRTSRRIRLRNRRSDFRIQLEAHQGVLVDGDSNVGKTGIIEDDKMNDCLILNLSVGGAYGTCTIPLEVDDEKQLVIKLLRERIVIPAYVSRIDPPKVEGGPLFFALIFKHEGQTSVDQLHRFVARRQIEQIRKLKQS